MHRKVNLEGECVGELGMRTSRMRRAYFHPLPPLITCERGMCQMVRMDQLNVGCIISQLCGEAGQAQLQCCSTNVVALQFGVNC